METWLNKDKDNVQLAGLSMYKQERSASSGKIRGGGECFFVNKDWWAISYIREVSKFCSSKLEYLMISC
jgi:hypothetical protein